MIPDFDDMDIGTARAICTKILSREGPGWLTVEDTRALLACRETPYGTGRSREDRGPGGGPGL